MRPGLRFQLEIIMKGNNSRPNPKRGAFPTPRNVLAGATPYMPKKSGLDHDKKSLKPEHTVGRRSNFDETCPDESYHAQKRENGKKDGSAG